jgi:hypothetical protein
MVAHRLRRTARWKLFRPLVFWFEPCVDGLLRGEPLRHVAGVVFQIENYLVSHCLLELVSVNVCAEDVVSGRLVLAQKRRAGEADEDGVVQPTRSATRTTSASTGGMG